jgi:hypothetical protein
MGRTLVKLGLLGLLAFGTTACTVTVAGQGPSPDVGLGAPRTIHVPPGHYPPPGACRVWYLGRPPGHQPPPGPCHHLHAGHGAFVLHNGKAWDAEYDWRTYARRHPGTVPEVIINITSR